MDKHEYVWMLHKSLVNKIKSNALRKVASVRLRANNVVNGAIIETLAGLEELGYVMLLTTTGAKSKLPSFVYIRGCELRRLKSQIVQESKSSLVTIELREVS